MGLEKKRNIQRTSEKECGGNKERERIIFFSIVS
jgi:hypothetical protein